MSHPTLWWRTLHPGFCRRFPHCASQKWWSSCCLWIKHLEAVRHSTLAWRTALHPGFCRQFQHCASQKWWSGCCLWRKYTWSMQHSTFGWRTALHPGSCKWWSHCASQKWWSGCCLWRQCTWSMQHSTFGWRTALHPGCCKWFPHCASQKWWSGCCLWRQCTWSMQHSTFGWRTVLHPGFCRHWAHSSSQKWWSSRCLWIQLPQTTWHSISQALSFLPLQFSDDCWSCFATWDCLWRLWQGWWLRLGMCPCQCNSDVHRAHWRWGAEVENAQDSPSMGRCHEGGTCFEDKDPASSNGIAKPTGLWKQCMVEAILSSFDLDASIIHCSWMGAGFSWCLGLAGALAAKAAESAVRLDCWLRSFLFWWRVRGVFQGDHWKLALLQVTV